MISKIITATGARSKPPIGGSQRRTGRNSGSVSEDRTLVAGLWLAPGGTTQLIRARMTMAMMKTYSVRLMSSISAHSGMGSGNGWRW